MLRDLLEILLESNLPDNTRTDLCEAVSILGQIAPENEAIVSEFIDRVCGLSVGRWSVSPQFMGGGTGLKGFRNLGATCYVNSILQQCFRIPAFQYLLLSADVGDREELRVLQVLLHYALRSRRPFCNPETFIQLWPGWGGAPIDPHDQQDAHEFVQLFVDPLPDRLKWLFQGEMTNYIQAVTDREFTKIIPESFYSLGLGVETAHDLEAALKAFAERQIFMNNDQYKSEDGQAFDAAKLQKIKVTPPILVFQLKRFSYNRQTHDRQKLHTKFTFPPFVSLDKYMDKPQSVRYSLNGVVLHAGEVNSGHYSSIVRVGHGWFKFNDMEVVPTDEDSLKTESFGGAEVRTVAYLLF
jgi:uncharacterized UBP type Zn finger protein